MHQQRRAPGMTQPTASRLLQDIDIHERFYRLMLQLRPLVPFMLLSSVSAR